MKPMVYVAGPIDSVAATLAWREEVVQSLTLSGINCFCPWRAYALPSDIDDIAALSVMNINRDVLMLHANAMLAVIHPGCRTVGTFREIEIATDMGLPTVVYAPDYVNHVCLADTHQAATLDRAIYLIKRMAKAEGMPSPAVFIERASRIEKRRLQNAASPKSHRR